VNFSNVISECCSSKNGSALKEDSNCLLVDNLNFLAAIPRVDHQKLDCLAGGYRDGAERGLVELRESRGRKGSLASGPVILGYHVPHFVVCREELEGADLVGVAKF
jgi:hypothetical protein